MSELKTCFKKVDYDLSGLLHYIEIGDIALPDIQRPFVWSNAKVRDLFDSMYRGFPVGYFLFWENVTGGATKQIGVGSKPNGPTSSRGASNWARTGGKIMKGMAGVAGGAEQTARHPHASAQGDRHHCDLRRDRQERRQQTNADNFRPTQNDTSLKSAWTIRF